MYPPLSIEGTGHALGSRVVSNESLADSLGLKPTWFAERTGIMERRICAPGENVATLAKLAVEAACDAAGITTQDIGSETILLHIQNGMTSLTPPSGVLLARDLGIAATRVVALDGVCAEPIAALDLAVAMLASHRCERIILSASADFLDVIDPKDPATAGLFGAGAGAIILTAAADSGLPMIAHSIRWNTHAQYSDLGQIPILDRVPNDVGIDLRVGYYAMNGSGLARAALQLLPGVIDSVLSESQWDLKEVDLVISHQPNARLLDIGIRALKLEPAKVPMPVRKLGNMGPASLLVNLSLAHDAGTVCTGSKVLLVAFGLGFSCGAAALEFPLT